VRDNTSYVSQISLCQIDVSHIRVSQIGLSHIRASQIGLSHIHVSQIRAQLTFPRELFGILATFPLKLYDCVHVISLHRMNCLAKQNRSYKENRLILFLRE
jgi:hypothetical protein